MPSGRALRKNTVPIRAAAPGSPRPRLGGAGPLATCRLGDFRVAGELVPFLAKVIVISLSGVMAPGAVTAAALAAAPRNRHAGALVALGHAVVEFPLMVLIVVGFSYWFRLSSVGVAVALAGGAMLLVMAFGMLRNAVRPVKLKDPSALRGPLVTGIVLTAGNPLFLVWWATVGLTLANQAASLGIMAFVLFALAHWSLDLMWLEALTLAAHRGSKLLGGKAQRILVALCGAAMAFFGVRFIWTAASAAWHWR